MEHLIAPSILAGDFANLQRDIEMLNNTQADYIHVDIMDGVFVPNISFGIPVCEAIYKHAKKPLDVHLMIVEPEKYFQAFHDAGAATISFHYEATHHVHRALQQLKDLGLKAGVAINPHTNVQLLEDVIKDIDIVCIMSVNPGFGGQKFIEQTYKKIAQLKEIIVDAGASTKIEIDGGVNLDNAPKLLKAGADILVAGSFVFKSEDPAHTISELKSVTFE